MKKTRKVKTVVNDPAQAAKPEPAILFELVKHRAEQAITAARVASSPKACSWVGCAVATSKRCHKCYRAVCHLHRIIEVPRVLCLNCHGKEATT
jgi:hypothetical protein